MIEQLHSPDPALRREAIVALANAKDASALPALAALYRTDPDPELRALALRAGRYIQQYGGAAAPPPPPTPPPSYSVVAPTAAPTGSLLDLPRAQEPQAPTDASPVSTRDQEIAQRMLNTATTYHIDGDKGRAIEHLGKALSLNPDLRKEPFVANLAMTLTGMGIADAMPILTHPDRRNALIGSAGGVKPRRQQGQTHGKDAATATWDNVAIDMALYWLVVTLGLVAIFVFAINAIEDLYNSMPQTTAQQVDLETFFAASLTGLILVAVFYGILSAISLFIQSGAIHVAARYLLGGDGTFVYLLRRYVPFQTIVMLGMIAAFVVVVLLGSQAEIWYLAPLLIFGASIAVWYYTIKLVADVYAFGWWSGCGAIFLGSLLLAIVSVGGNLLLAGLVSALLGTGS